MRIRESRALFGAVALMFTGAILSSMIYQYFAGQYTDDGIVRSRAWWEIVLNIQVLSLAFMWFCYADRVKDRRRHQALLMWTRMLFGLVAVAAPFLIALVSIYFGWFEKRPSLDVIDKIFYSMVGFWVCSGLIPRLLAYFSNRNKQTFFDYWVRINPQRHLLYLPSAIGILILILGVWFNLNDVYFLLPFLFYLQSAVPFFRKAVCGSRRRVAAE